MNGGAITGNSIGIRNYKGTTVNINGGDVWDNTSGSVNASESTCLHKNITVTESDDGLKTYTCNDCGATYTGSSQAPEPQGVWTETDATCTAQGLISYADGTRSMSYTTPVDPDNHGEDNVVTDGGHDATCIVTGLTDGAHCSECEKKLAEQTEIPVDSTNHVGETELRGAKEATYDEEGYTGDIHCVDCGALIQKGEVIPLLTDDSTPDDSTPDDNTSDNTTPGGDTSGDTTPGGTTPVIPGDDTPVAPAPAPAAPAAPEAPVEAAEPDVPQTGEASTVCGWRFCWLAAWAWCM